MIKLNDKKAKTFIIIRIFLVILIIALSSLIYLKFNIGDIKPKFYLLGDDQIVLEVGSKYEEPGYVAIFNKSDYRKNVSVISNLDTNKLGNYIVSYTMYMKYLKISRTIQRKIMVVDTTKPELNVNMDDEVKVKQNEFFSPALATAKDNYDGDLSSEVEIKSNVDTTKPGTYYVKYAVKDSSNNKSEKEIKVNVLEKNPYIDVSITNQRLNYYEYGEVVLSTDVVTGKNNGTPTGNYSVLSKSTNVTLKGADYTSFVKYWIAFIGHSYGIHDASWRSTFGGDIYKYNGSHGCINVPYENVSKLYYMVDVGTPVYVHY